jgi:tripartite-type tricarboxylate transporter receptor subunit TctC
VESVVGSNWVGLAAPAGTPRDIVDKLNREVNRLLKMPEVIERFAAVGTEPGGSSPEELATKIREESARFARILGQINLKAE